MKMSEHTNEMLNRLLQELFSGNARIDNLFYNLQSQGYDRLAEAIHEPVAHVMGEWADQVSTLINHLNGRSVRYGLKDYIDEYDVKSIFSNLADYFDNLRKIVVKIIDEIEGYEEDLEIKIFMEDFLNRNIIKFNKQANEWSKACERLDENTFNIHIDDYTHYIK